MFKNYNMNQVVLPLDLEIKLQENDIAYAVNHVVESIPDEAFAVFSRETGCPAYHPRMMMKIILCAYTQSVFSGRKIEGLLKDSVRMMWLAQGYEPSYRTKWKVPGTIQFFKRKCSREISKNCSILLDGYKGLSSESSIICIIIFQQNSCLSR